MQSERMKRKVAKVGSLRLSPNEEALIIKAEVERRRKLRLQQVREQEKYIALQIREEVKNRRDQQLHHLAEELKAEWKEAQAQKIKALEKLYQSSLKAVGEGHQHAKENAPDLEAIAKQVVVCNERAEKRHREALKELKHKRESQLKEQNWHIRIRKKALDIEKERAANIASLPPPPPEPFEIFQEAKKVAAAKTYDVNSFSGTHYHFLEPYVDREMDTKQPDARLLAEEEGKRLDDLQMEDERERREQLEKAQLRGYHALKMVHLTQDREQLLKELEQMQQDDLCRRRQTVAQMPPQLFVPAYKRIEIREDFQRELEFAFEDLYTGDRKVKGDLILKLEADPLPAPSIGNEDEELDLSMDPDQMCPTQTTEDQDSANIEYTSKPTASESSNIPQSKLVLNKLLNRIRSQKGQRALKSDITPASEPVGPGSFAIDERLQQPAALSVQEGQPEPLNAPDIIKPPEVVDTTVMAGDSILLHPQEKAARVRMAAERHRQMESLEQQKQQQLALLQQLEQQRINLQENFQKAQLRMQESCRRESEDPVQPDLQMLKNVEVLHGNNDTIQQTTKAVGSPESKRLKEDQHLEIIRNYQQRLIQQSKQHQQSVEDARKRLQDYQNMLSKRYPSLSTTSVDPSTGQLKGALSVGQLPGTSGNVPCKLSPGTKSQFELVSFKENLEPLAPCLLNTAVIQRDSEQSSHFARPQVCPSQPADQYQICQTDFQQTRQRLSLESEAVFGALSKQPDSETRQPPSLRSHLESGALPEPTTSFGSQSLTDLKLIQPSVPKEYFEQDQKTVVKFCKGQFLPKPPIAVNSAEELVPDLPEVPRTMLVSPEPVATLQPQRVPPSLIHAQPRSLPCEQHIEKKAVHEPQTLNGYFPLPPFSNPLQYQQQLLASSKEIQNQQNHLKELQLQLDQQRELLLSRQKLQEQALIQKQNELESQMQRQQEALFDFLQDKQISQPIGLSQNSNDQQFSLISSILRAVEHNNEEDTPLQDHKRTLLGREHKWRPSKPPVTKIKVGPVLEQHELSAIQEIESPKSSRLSFTGRKDLTSSPGQTSFMSLVCDPSYSKSSSDASHSDTNLSRVSTSTKDHSSGDSNSSSKSSGLSWREMLTRESGSSRSTDSNIAYPFVLGNPPTTLAPSEDSEPVLCASSYAAAVGMGVLQHNTNSRPDEEIPCLTLPVFNQSPHSVDASSDCIFSTTISTGSIVTSEKADSSPGDTESSPRTADPCSASFAQGLTSSPMSLPVSVPLHPPRRHELISANQESQPPAQKHRSQIQQIIDKYTKDLEESFERNIPFHAPVIDLNFSHPSNENSNLQSFHFLEAQYDYDSSSLSIQQSERTPHFDELQVSKHSYLSTESHEPLAQQQSPSFCPELNNDCMLPSDATNELQINASPMGTSDSDNDAHAPALRLDFSHFENSEFGLPSFHSLEPKSDHDLRTMSSFQLFDRIHHLQGMAVHSKSLVCSPKNQESQSQKCAASVVEKSDRLTSVESEKAHNTTELTGDSFISNISLGDSSKSFHQLYTEMTYGEQSLTVAELAPLTIRSENVTDPTLDEYCGLSSEQKCHQLQDEVSHTSPPLETLRSQSACSVQEYASFYDLDLSQNTAKNNLLMDNLILDCTEMKRGDSSCFDKLADVNVNSVRQVENGMTALNSGTTIAKEESHKYVDVAFSDDHSVTISAQDLTPKSQLLKPVKSLSATSDRTNKHEFVQITSSGSSQVLNGTTTHAKMAAATLLQTSIPKWDIGPGHGIMEEPDLTLISLNDSCVTVPDLEVVHQAENQDCKFNTLPNINDGSKLEGCGSKDRFTISQPDKENQICILPESSTQDESPGTDTPLTQEFAAMHLSVPSSPENLQKAFLKKKRDFIQQSSKRLEEIKIKPRHSKKPAQTVLSKKESPQLASQTDSPLGSDHISPDPQLKKVAQVKVCTPGDRKTAEVEMHQRTLRLYNQLEEVKTKMMEKTRHETYAKNRGKAKEFHKKTLEKLRAKMS
ncbi:centrosomal protein of 295 kDa isoform X2 [Lissotriton helveticus]